MTASPVRSSDPISPGLVDEALRILRRVQWIVNTETDIGACPCCRCSELSGHAADCALAAVLAADRGQAPSQAARISEREHRFGKGARMTKFGVTVAYADDGPGKLPGWQATAEITPAPDSAVMFSAHATGATREEARLALKRAVRGAAMALIEARI